MQRFVLIVLLISTKLLGQKSNHNNASILPGAYQTQQYLPLLKGKKVGIFANHTTLINGVHLVDSLKSLGINITKTFAPEHGFRGIADAGEKIDNYVDAKTGVPIISLYGKKRKPTAADLNDVDVLIFDIQDVGTRFYTYISSLQEFLESAIANDKPLIILDRPNPNGFYVDGPVLDSNYKSFIGMQPIPIVYGMTIGEYAKMLLGEQMISWRFIKKQDKNTSLGEMLGFEKERLNFKLTVIKCKNYTHSSKYILPVKPSPNLPDMASIYWYASNCLFEGTVLSEGRGTEHPFCIFGHPDYKTNNDSSNNGLFKFTPISKEGAKDPKLKNTTCYGWNVYNTNNEEILKTINNKIQLSYLIAAYKLYPNKQNFFIIPKPPSKEYFFNKLTGNADLMKALQQGLTEEQIRASWQPKLNAFKKIRKKYLLYTDFE